MAFMNNWKISILFILFISLISGGEPALAIKIGLYDNVMQNYIAVSNNGMLVNGETNQKICPLTVSKKHQICFAFL